MKKVITYGTFDLLHRGHISLLKRAKELGDYLIVGVTADDFDKNRGKINVQQSLLERIEAVRSLGIADEIIIEEYEGQKIDDIRRNDVDIFTVGSDWEGKFDYLREYCEVVYLERTQGISSSDLRNNNHMTVLGLVGDTSFLNKIRSEANFVNGVKIGGICSNNSTIIEQIGVKVFDFDEMLDNVDAVYIRSQPEEHYYQIKKALSLGKHVLCESPVTLSVAETRELYDLAHKNRVVLMEGIKTAYTTAYSRLLLLLKTGKIGDVISVDSVCTSLRKNENDWDGFYEWGPTALLPILQVLGNDIKKYNIVIHNDKFGKNDFTKIDFVYDKAVASIRVGDGVKSEGELIVSGTKGYIYIPAPWWKTEYFEIRYEDQNQNRRYFYQLDGEGIRYELVAFIRAIERGFLFTNIENAVTYKISEVMEKFVKKDNITEINN